MDAERLQRLLGGPPAPETGLREGGGQLTLSQDSEAERAAVERLLGRSPRQGRSLSVDLEAMPHALRRAGVAADLRAALEALDGPLVDARGAAASLGGADPAVAPAFLAGAG